MKTLKHDRKLNFSLLLAASATAAVCLPCVFVSSNGHLRQGFKDVEYRPSKMDEWRGNAGSNFSSGSRCPDACGRRKPTFRR